MTQNLRSESDLLPVSRPASEEETDGTRPAPSHDGDPLRAEARKAIESGRIPARSPARIWGGDASGAKCTVCETPVAGGELEFEIEFEGQTGPWQLHSRCLEAWETERRAYLVRPGANGTPVNHLAPGSPGNLPAETRDGSIAAGERNIEDQRGSST